ncbi:lysophosphatidic acid receptor 4-like [Pelodytes ibericus]
MLNNSNCPVVGTPTIFISGYSIILFLGLILNVAALYCFFRLPQLRSPTTVYMKNLAFSDLLLVCTLPLRIYSYMDTSKHLPQWLCMATGTMLLLNMYGSIFFLACISLDRCLAVCFPLRSKRFRQRAPWVCAGVWCINIVACSMAYIMTLRIGTNETGNSSCLAGEPPVVRMIGPTVGSLVSGFLIPLGIMSLSSWALLRAVGRSQLVQTGMVNKEKIVHMLTANLTIFLLCFLPYHAILLLYQLPKADLCLNEYYKITLLIACCNAVLDPLAYYFAAETLKRTLVKEMRLVGESDISGEKLKISGVLPANGL